MNPLQRATSAMRTVVGDPVGRRAYVGRLKWLIRGSGDLHAHSLEYRAGLTGLWKIPAERHAPDEEVVLHCPGGCGAQAPLSHLYERRYVYRLTKTVASTASGATLMCGSQEPPFFVRESITWPFESILTHGLEVPEVKQVEEQITGPAIIFPTTSNYYHWLIEDLPAVIRAHAVYSTAPLLAFRDGITDRHRIVAQHLEADLKPSALVVALDQQILPGRSNDSWFIHPADAALLATLGQELTEHDGSPGNDRIYISRRGTSRPLPDEEKVEQALRQRGFAILRLEDMPWLDQIRAFQNARTIIAPHGAGLANLIFTPAGATVTEITFGLHYNRCFEWICHVAGHHYTMCAAESPSLVADLLDGIDPMGDRA